MRDKREKFVSLAESRVTKTMKDIQLIGNLSNLNSYDYKEEDVRKIFRALQKEIDAAKSRFADNTKSSTGSFRLE